MLGPAIEDALGLVQAAAREQQLDYALAVSAPLLDLIEIAMVGDQRLVRFFVGPVGHLTAAIFISAALAAWRYRLQSSWPHPYLVIRFAAARRPGSVSK